MKVLILVSILFLFAGCATTEKVNELESKVIDLQGQVDQLGSQVTEYKTKLDAINDDINSVNENIKSLNKNFPTTSGIKTIENKKEDNLSKPGQCKAITKAGAQCTRTAMSGSEYCWQHQGYSKTVSKDNSSSGNSSDGTIYTGPRGGKYYINKNGKKTYIRKK